MASPASVRKHPVHPMLIVFPVGLWIFSLVCDLVYVLHWGGEDWASAALYLGIAVFYALPLGQWRAQLARS